MDDVKTDYQTAYEDWQAQLTKLHEVFLEGRRPESPDRMKGLLNREVRAFQRYSDARRRLLGIPDEDQVAGDEGLNF
ncbi:MAG TPA: hypothetical protein VFO84_05900 [Dehalococcoidia bacterium]|nr:hypothetical protein [Dehalococcoidia bacterium]